MYVTAQYFWKYVMAEIPGRNITQLNYGGYYQTVPLEFLTDTNSRPSQELVAVGLLYGSCFFSSSCSRNGDASVSRGEHESQPWPVRLGGRLLVAHLEEKVKVGNHAQNLGFGPWTFFPAGNSDAAPWGSSSNFSCVGQ